jgi:hypothetical protein
VIFGMGERYEIELEAEVRQWTAFHKTRMRETAEIDRARKTQQQCEAGHRPADCHEVYDRPVKEDEL